MAKMRDLSRNIGAICSFVGLCRDEGGILMALEIEHYPDMATQEIATIAAQAAARFPLYGLTIIHRYGSIAVGEEIVLVIAAAQHRVAAFDSVDFVMDYLKIDAPFWKKAHFSDGRQAEWLGVAARDINRRARW